jgi:ABC-type nitrate/sulfonate/bicarbonate transport system substrate-binding protein
MAESKTSPEFQSEIMDAISKSQAAVVDAIEKWATTVQAMKPELPEVNLPFADSLKMTDRLPKPQDVVRNAYDFAEQLLANQRKFAEDVLRATAPLLGTAGSGAKKDG